MALSFASVRILSFRKVGIEFSVARAANPPPRNRRRKPEPRRRPRRNLLGRKLRRSRASQKRSRLRRPKLSLRPRRNHRLQRNHQPLRKPRPRRNQLPRKRPPQRSPPRKSRPVRRRRRSNCRSFPSLFVPSVGQLDFGTVTCPGFDCGSGLNSPLRGRYGGFHQTQFLELTLHLS